MRWKSRKQITVRFLHRTVLFMTALSSGVFLFYYIGNIQQFLDVTLRGLLEILSAISFVTFISGCVLILLEISVLLHKRKTIYAFLAVIAFLCTVYSLLLTLFARSVLFLSSGI